MDAATATPAMRPIDRQVSAMRLDSRVTSKSRPLNALYLLQQQGASARYREYARVSSRAYQSVDVR